MPIVVKGRVGGVGGWTGAWLRFADGVTGREPGMSDCEVISYAKCGRGSRTRQPEVRRGGQENRIREEQASGRGRPPEQEWL